MQTRDVHAQSLVFHDNAWVATCEIQSGWVLGLNAFSSYLFGQLANHVGYTKHSTCLLKKIFKSTLFLIYPENIRLDEDVLKVSFIFLFRRRLQDVLIKTNMFTLALRLRKTSWSRPIYLSCPYVFKTSSRHLQDVLKTSSRRLQNVFKASQRCLQDVCKTSSRRPAKISSRRFQGVPSS